MRRLTRRSAGPVNSFRGCGVQAHCRTWSTHTSTFAFTACVFTHLDVLEVQVGRGLELRSRIVVVDVPLEHLDDI
eukprot:9607-Eustigmatos_ZCMA.PRE.1